MKLKHFLSILLLSIVLLTSCSSNNDNESSGTAKITAKVDGINFTSADFLVFGQLFSFSGYNQLAIGGSTDNINNIKSIDFTVDFESTTELTVGLEITDSSSDFEAYANYVDFDNDIDAWSDNDGGSFYLKITKIDKTNKLISGEFHFIAVEDVSDGGESYNITNGIFTDVSY